MGSGVFPTGTTVAANFGTRAFIRGTRYYAAKNAGLMTSTTGAAYASDTACYRALRTTDWGVDWNPSLIFGGPGGDGSGCN